MFLHPTPMALILRALQCHRTQLALQLQPVCKVSSFFALALKLSCYRLILVPCTWFPGVFTLTLPTGHLGLAVLPPGHIDTG